MGKCPYCGADIELSYPYKFSCPICDQPCIRVEDNEDTKIIKDIPDGDDLNDETIP